MARCRRCPRGSCPRTSAARSAAPSASVASRSLHLFLHRCGRRQALPFDAWRDRPEALLNLNQGEEQFQFQPIAASGKYISGQDAHDGANQTELFPRLHDDFQKLAPIEMLDEAEVLAQRSLYRSLVTLKKSRISGAKTLIDGGGYDVCGLHGDEDAGRENRID